MTTSIPGYGSDAVNSWTTGAAPSSKNIGTSHFSLVEIQVSSPVYLTSAEHSVVWSGNLYQAFPFSISNIRNNPHSAPEPLRIGISNCSRAFTAAVAGSGVVGKNVVIRRSHWLAGSTHSDPFVLYSGFIDTIAVEEKMETAQIYVEIKSDFLRWSSGIPRNNFSVACNWAFKSGTPGCQYTGAASICDRSYEACKFLGNTDRFRGFRFGPMFEDRQIWWGKAREW